MTAPISRFTPSLMSARTLEDLFVAREPTLRSIMRRISEAARSETRNQTLIVGPRGSGKTHLISLTYHRTKALIERGEPLQLAWLPEDAWTIVSYRHLLAAILERLEDDSARIRDSVEVLEARLVELSRTRGTIVVLVENLDRILHQLEDIGQQKLRHFLQHECRLLLVATSTALDRSLVDQAQPFFGYFSATRLRPLTPEQGRDMLVAAAAHAGDEELATFLTTELALSRIKAIAHLAGGQPRLWALLASSLRVADLTSLVDLLLTRFDDLTPYYQEQLAALSPQQRLIVAELAETDHPLHVGALAERLDIGQRSIASSIGELADRGWVAPVTTVFAHLLDRRRTYYELAEPMARLSFQIKESRGRPIRLVIDFLKAWFDPSDLSGLASVAESGGYAETVLREFGSDAVGSVVRRLTSLPVTRAPSLALLGRLDDALAAAEAGDASLVMTLPTSLRSVLEESLAEGADHTDSSIRLRVDLNDAALDEVGNVPGATTSEWISRAERLVTAHPRSVSARIILIRWFSHAWRFDMAEAALDALTSEAGRDDARVHAAGDSLARSYESAGNMARAIRLFEQTLAARERVLGTDHPDTLGSRNNLAHAYQSTGDLKRAIPLYEQTLADSQRVLGPDHRNTLTSRNNRAMAYESAGHPEQAIPLHEQLLAHRARVLGPDHPDALTSQNNLASAYLSTGDLERAITLYEQTLVARQRLLRADHPDTLTSRNNLAYAYQSAGDLERAIPLFERTLAARERVLGPDHPDTLTSRNNLAATYQSAGDPGQAVPLFEQTLADSERVLGTDHPNTLTLRNNLAYAYQSFGDLGRAVPLYEQTLAARERVLGPDHPDTLTTRNYLASAHVAAGDRGRAIPPRK